MEFKGKNVQLEVIANKGLLSLHNVSLVLFQMQKDKHHKTVVSIAHRDNFAIAQIQRNPRANVIQDSIAKLHLHSQLKDHVRLEIFVQEFVIFAVKSSFNIHIVHFQCKFRKVLKSGRENL
jgi:hypothetical protein